MRLLAVAAASLVLPLLLVPGAVPQGKPDPYAAHIAPTPPRSPEDERKCFTLPPGFEAQLVACEPDIRKPINIAFDASGRLWVTQSTEYPFPAPPGKGRDAVKILSDFGPDGRARKINTFADDLNIPIGVLPVGDGALVYSIPNIYRLHASPRTGKADRREVLYATYEYRDTHGMTGEFMWGFDGWVYACHGFSNTSTIKAKDGSSIKMRSGNTYRIKPDGSHIEQWTWGQVNPFGLAFDPLGNLYSCDCHSRPIYQLLRGAYYPSFGAPHDGLGFGPEMVTHDHGSTAIAGIAYYAASHFPKEFRDNIFIGNVVTNRINRDRLERHGSTYRGIPMPDFLASSDPWFRPVDIKLGPDGALWVADFYTRIIGHYEVPLKHPLRTNEHGRIWRIVYRGPDGKIAPPPASLAKANDAALVRALGDDNLTVRLTAAQQLVRRGGRAGLSAVSELLTQGRTNPYQRAHGLWVLERRGGLEQPLLAAAARDAEPVVRVHALRVLSERPNLWKAERDLVLAGLKDRDAFVQRAAAEALGQHPTAMNLRPLLDLRRAVPPADTHLLHMTRMALRNQLKPASTWEAVYSQEWTETEARALADVCPGVHTAQAAHYLLRHIRQYREPAERLVRYVHHIARYETEPDFEGKLVGHLRNAHAADLMLQAALYKATQHGLQERGARQPEVVTAWAQDLAKRLLASPRSKELLAGVEVAGLVKSEAMFGLVAELAGKKGPEANRRAAVSALVAIDPARAVAPLARILADARTPVPVREQAANSLASTNRPEARAELLKILASAPARLETAIATALAGSRPGAEKLLEAVGAGKASARLLQEPAVGLRLRQAKLPDLQRRLKQLTRGLPPADQRLHALIDRRRAAFQRAERPDTARGAKVFEKNCAGCHQVANKGSKIGPQLDGIGSRGLDRILEDILDPNRNVDQEFRATTLTLMNGQQLIGLLLRQEGAVLVLADAQGKEVRVPREQVEQKTVSPLSPMPANFGEQIPEAEFTDLLAYLLAQRVPGVDPRKGEQKPPR